LEDSGFYPQTEARNRYEVLVECARLFGGSGVVEAGAAPFAAIAVERELRDYQKGASGVEDAAIHFALLIGEDSEVEYFSGDEFGIGFGIEFGDPQENQKAGADLAGDNLIDDDSCFGYAL
jgi:hypothetical protein